MFDTARKKTPCAWKGLELQVDDSSDEGQRSEEELVVTSTDWRVLDPDHSNLGDRHLNRHSHIADDRGGSLSWYPSIGDAIFIPR